jgi:predicted permease
MEWFHTLREWSQRLRGVLHCGRRDRDMEEELRLNLELAEEEARCRGADDDAVRLLRVRMGGQTQAMELLRDQRGWPWLEDLLRDVRQGLRALRRAPGFAAVVILTLALGIGANTAIFSIINGVLLRPLRYPHSAQMMYLTTQLPASGLSQFPVSVAEYLEFQQFNHSFADVGAFRTGEANLVTGDRALRIRSATIDAHLLNTLEVHADQGRLLTADETGLVSPPPIAVISYELWQSTFGAQPLIGRDIDIDGRRLQVVGVMARGADLMDGHPEIWLPLGFTDEEHRARNNHNLYLVGRLKEGVTAASARVELKTLLETWAARAGITPGADHAGHVFLPAAKGRGGHILEMTALTDQILGRVSRSIWVLQAAVGLVLLIVCANVANLLLARAETRHREFALLTALGASRSRLRRKALTEAIILSLAGGALGVLLARAVLDVLVRAYPASLPRMDDVAVDFRVMLTSFAVSVVCGLLFGFAYMMRPHSDSIAEALKSATRGSSRAVRGHVRRVFVIAETALALIVVVGAGLLLQTVHNLKAVDAGFDRSRLLTFSITLPPRTSGLLGRVRAYQRILEGLRNIPGASMATGMTVLPLESPLSSYQTEIANVTTTSGPAIPSINYYQRVMSGFFETMGIPILQGRSFQSSDAVSGGMAAVVNETLANTYWKGRNPIGQRLRPFSTDNSSPWFTVIGVAKDVKQSSVDQPPGTEVYLLIDQLATDSPRTWVAIPPPMIHMVVRSALPLATLAPAIARTVRDIDPSMPVARLREMDEVFTESIRRPRLLAQLLASFSVLALLLAGVGIYGVLAYMVAERRQEIGIRMALGAGRSRVLTDMIREGLQLVIAGVLAGVGSAILLNRLIVSLLFGVAPTDVTTFAMAIPTIALIAGVACVLPAWRASRLDPNVVLRSE